MIFFSIDLPLRLPPYYPDFNLIEMMWGEIKGEMAHQNIGSSSLEHKE